MNLKKILHSILLEMMPGKRNFSIEILNKIPLVHGNKIFVMNHSNVHDAPIACEVIKEHLYILVGKQSLELMDRIFFRLNGVVYIDRKSKKSRRQGFEKMLDYLKKGHNMLMYPEGTWNLTPSKPMLPMNWGCIELARSTGVPIIPLVVEYKSDCCYVKIGKPMYVNHEMDKKVGIEQLEDAMATLKWDIWEQFPIQKRSDELKDEFEQMIQQRIEEYPKLNLEYESSVVRKR